MLSWKSEEKMFNSDQTLEDVTGNFFHSFYLFLVSFHSFLRARDRGARANNARAECEDEKKATISTCIFIRLLVHQWQTDEGTPSIPGLKRKHSFCISRLVSQRSHNRSLPDENVLLLVPHPRFKPSVSSLCFHNTDANEMI